MADKVVMGIEIMPQKEQLIKTLCNSKKVHYKRIPQEGYDKTLGSLAGIKGIPSVPQENIKVMINEEMLIFSGFSSEELDRFLESYKQNGIEKITLKAIITVHNILWSPKMLFQAIREERNAVR